MEKKYKLTAETCEYKGHVLHRIVALRDFDDVKAGDKGGWIEKESNLSQNGYCWVGDEAKVYSDARVYGGAKVFDNALVYGDANVYGKVKVYGCAKVYGDAVVHGDASVHGNAEVYGDAMVYCSAEVCGNTKVYGNAMVYGNAEVYGDAMVYCSAEVCDNTKVYGNAMVYGNARVYGNAVVCGDAEVINNMDYIVFKNWWGSGRYFTWTRSNNKWLVGCFYGTGEKLIAKAYKDSESSGREYERIVRYVEAINKPIKKLNLIQRIVCRLFKIK